MTVLAGWKHDSPRGPIEIDPKTRDIIQNIYIMQVAVENGRDRHEGARHRSGREGPVQAAGSRALQERQLICRLI